jgi:hypothetical protein
MPEDELPVVMYAVCKLLQTLQFAGWPDQMRNRSQL